MDRNELGRIAWEANSKFDDESGKSTRVTGMDFDDLPPVPKERHCRIGEAVARAVEKDIGQQIEANFVKNRVVK